MDSSDSFDSPNNLCFQNTPGGGISSSGYKIDTFHANNELPLMVSNNSYKKQKGGQGPLSSTFQDLAVPAGLLFIQQIYNPNKYSIEEVKEETMTLNDSLFNKLLDLTEPKKKTQTRKLKNKKIKNKKSKKL